MAQDQENSYKLWQALSNDYDMGSYEQFKKDVQDATKRQKLYNAIKDEYDLPDFDGFSKQLGIVSTAAEQQPTGQAVPAGQTTSAGEMVGQAAQQDQPTVEPYASQTRAQVKPGAVQQQATPVYNYTYFDESAIDPDEGELRMSMKPANWAYSERVNKSRGSHTKDNSPILRMSLDGDKLDIDVEREALADLKGMSDDEIYKYTNDLYNLAWGKLTDEERRAAASRLAAAGQELHVRDLGLGHAGDVDRNTDEVQTNLQDPKYRKLYDQGQWADPVDTLSKQYDQLFAEQATGGTMGQQQATKMANRVLRAADKAQMFTWALQEAERTGGDPYKIYENIYDRFHAAVKEKLGAYNTRGQAAGLLGDIDAMIAEKYSAAEKEDRSRRSGFARMLSDAMSADRGGDHVEDILMNDPDMWALRYAKRTIEGVNNMIAEADHNAASGNFAAWLESSFAGGAVRGFGQAVFDPRTWDMGLGDVRDATALMTALNKSDKGQPLTKAEQAMLDAKAVELAANAYFKSQVGYGYEAGKVTGESLPFMLEMMINPASKAGGLAVNKLVRYALKRFPQRGARAAERQAVRAAERRAVRMAERRGTSTLREKAANRILESAGLIIETAGKKTAAGKAVRAAVKTAGNVAGSAVMAGTTGLPGVIADTQNRMIGQLDYDADEAGKVHVTGHGFGVPMIEAFKDALVARGIENVTEMSEFDVLSNWLGGLTRKALDKLHMSDVYKFFDDIKMSDVAKVVQDFEKNTHWQGTFGEYLEEVEGGILNAWLVGDQTLDADPETGVFNPDNNVKTYLGVSLLGGIFSTVQTVGYRTPKARMRKNIDDADKQASELWGGSWQQFKNSVDGADDEEMEVLLANIVVNGNYSVEQRRAAAQYIKSVVAYRGAMKGEEIRAVSGESNPNDEQSYEQGYQAQGEEREGITDELQQAEQRLIDMGFNMDSFEGWTSDKFERTIKDQDHGYSDEELSVIREYLRAKAASDGINQRVEDDIDTQVQQASDLVDKQTNQGTGMVHRAVLNERHGSQEVYVTGGQLVMTGDGTMIDTEASDQSLFVYNPATGQPEQYTPSDFQSVDDPVSPEQLKNEAARDIRMSVEQQAQNDKNGVLPFQVGDTYEILTNGQPATVTVVEDQGDNVAVQRAGSQQVEIVPKQQIQEAASAMKQAKRNAQMPATLPTRSVGARDNTAPKAAQSAAIPRQANAPVAPAAQSPALPMDEKTGEPVWNKTTPEQGYNHLAQSGMTPEDIGTMIDDRIAQADAAIEKASHGGTIDQRLQARQAKDYWENVKALHEAAMAQPAATGTAAQQSPTGQPTTTGQNAPAGTVRVEAGQAETMPVGNVAVNVDGTRAEDRGQLGIRPEDEAYFLKTMSPRVMRLLDKVAKSLGWKIRLYNGTNANERGRFGKGVVWVNRRTNAKELAQWILGHEMTHGMATRTGRKDTYLSYVELANKFKRREWDKKYGEGYYEQYIKDTIEAYKKHLKKIGEDPSVVNRAYVEEEIACDVTGDLLMNNPDMIGKLFSGVESPGKVKGIIDMIVDFLNWLKSKLPFRSEERQALDDLSKRLNNLYRDAKAHTDIAKSTAREEGSQVESGEGERTGSSFSITGNAEGSGFTASETVLEIWRVPQEDGTYKEEEHWVKKPLLDSEGNVVFRMGGREYSGKNPITVDDLKSNPDTILNYMLQDALRAGTIDEVKADQVRQQYADMLNLYLEKGLAENGGFENLENNWLWVGETVFRTVASNSDEQYSYSMDITKVCKKNEAVIRAISALQVRNGYGVTPAQILEIYEATDAEGFQVPCPVCYVFSRYINNGKYATAIVNGMKKYGNHLPGQPEAWTAEQWVDEMNKAKATAEKMETPLKHANEDVKVILQQIDTLCREITSGKLSADEAESKRRHVRALDQRYRAALDVISQEAIPRFIKSFVLEGSDQGGWSLREDAALPDDMDDFTLHALDIRKTASAMEKYPAITRYRRAGGSAGGKEITFASNNELGTIVMGLGVSKGNLDDYPNYYQLAAEAATDEERQALLQKARDRFDKALLYAQRQTLRGGQRMWSWSDNIESLSSDVASNLMQLELLGGALQTYSKQLEGVKMVAAMNGYVNASLMGYGDGIREVGPDEIDDNGRLRDDIWDVNNKGRRRIIANAGSPVYHNEADGKDYVLVFDDVVGIDPFGHDGKRGLFSLNEEYDRAGNILVGMNDIHVRAAMADPRVFFIIPWHASGMHNHILRQMFNILGVNMDNFVSTDYTNMQEETNFLQLTEKGKLKYTVSADVEAFWDSHSYEDEFACGTGHIENGNHQGGLSESQKHYRALRDAIFDGAVKEGTKEYEEIMADEFLSQVYRQVTTRVADGKMTEKDKEFIYPYEYWQMTEVDETGNEVPARVENADVNGRRYVEYCRRMGFKPKFTGKYDKKAGTLSPEGNFADDPGYWKLLIDRRMYDRRGNYQDLTPVDSSGLDSSMYDPDQTQEEFNVTEVATNEGAEKIADMVHQRDTERTGTSPAPNLDMSMGEAVSKYNEVTALQASLIKAEREALKAAETAKEKAAKAKEKEAQDVDGRKAKTVAKAKESARKAIEVAKQKAREVDEIAGQFGTVRDDIAQYPDNSEARFSLEDPRFREVVNNGGRLQIIQSKKGTFREVYDYETGEKRKVRASNGGWRIEGMPGEYNSREAAINEWRERSSGDLLWSVSDDGKYIEVEGEGDALERLSVRANDPGRADRWAQQRAENGRRIADDMASELGVTVHYVDDMTDEERAALSDRQLRAKGWFDPRTGDVYINLGNHNRLYDIVSTVLHNVVANKGLRGLFGDSFPGFLDQVYNNVDKHTRAEIDRIAERNGGDRRDATEEYLAMMAERMDIRHPENYQYLNDAVRDFAIETWKDGGLKWGHAIEDDDLRRVLYESYHNLQREGAMGVAQSVAFRDQVEREGAARNAAIPRPVNAVAEDDGVRFSIRTKPAPKKTLPVYKLMRLGDDGKLYPLYIDGAVPIELGTWYDADSPNMEMLVNLPAGVHLINPETGEATSLEDYNKQRGITKKSKYPSAEAVNEATANGMRWVYIEPTKGGQRRFGGEARRYWNLGINGSGTVSTYSMRPGWHAGSLPTMRQIGKGPGRNLRDDRFVWVEGEISADVDYNEEAHGNPDNDIPTHIPVDGFYLKATNANAKASQADRVGWYISGAFKPNRIMSDWEARKKIDEWNADQKHKDLQVEYDFPRESGKEFNAETMQLEEVRFSLSAEEIDAANNKYNNELQQQINGTLRQGHVYQLGEVSEAMLESGMQNLPIELVASRLVDKSMQDNHPFGLNEVKDLLKAIQNPLAVFRSATHIGSYVIMTDLKHGKKNFCVAVNTYRAKGRLVYSVRSVHYRPGLHYVNWISEGLCEYVRPGFVQNWLIPTKNELRSKPQYNSADVRSKLNDAAKVAQLFESPKYFEEKAAKTAENGEESKFSVEVEHTLSEKWRDMSEVLSNAEARVSKLKDGADARMRDIVDEAWDVVKLAYGQGKLASDEDVMFIGRAIDHIEEIVNGDIDKMGKYLYTYNYETRYRKRPIPIDALAEIMKERLDELTKDIPTMHSWKVKKTQKVTLDDLEKLFKQYNKDEYNDELFDRVIAVSRRFGVDNIKFVDLPYQTYGAALGGRIRFDKDWMNSPYVDDSMKCRALLHELIHHVTTHAFDYGADMLTENERQAVQALKDVFTAISMDKSFSDFYGSTNVKEMMAELVNPEFRDALKKKGLWQRIIDGIMKFFGFDVSDATPNPGHTAGETEKTDALTAVRNNLEIILEGANAESYHEDAWKKRAHNRRFSISVEEDRDYMDAVKRGDMAKASRMVGEAAKRAMPDTKVVDENGEPLVMYHTTTNEFTVFDKNRIDTSGHGHYIGFGFNFASHQTKYGPNVVKVYLDAKHPLRIDSRTLSEEQVVDILKGLGYRFARPSNTKSYDEQLREFVHNELRYYGGSDTEIYRWISNFSFDAKDVIDAFKDLGFDSSINYGFDGKISTVVVFDPEQIKSAEAVTRDDDGNVIPLSQRFDEGKKDIRFSLSEDTQKIFDTAKRKFGDTEDIREAGYVLPDGTMLDFSGRHELDPGSDSSHLAGRRHVDHRAVNQIDFVYDENGNEVDTGVSSDMPDFIKRGAIRIDANNGLINLSSKPTPEQRKVLRQLVAENGGTVDVDFGDGWDTEHSAYYDNTKATKVLGDIDRYFDEGIKPEGNARFSLSLGAPYQGSKGQIATRVVDALPGGRRFVDLFAGGGAVTHAAMLSGKYGEYRMNDINPAGQELFLQGMRGDYRDYQPREMTPEEFKAIKGTPEGLMLSYGGLGRNVDSDAESVARRVRRVQRLEDLKPYADQVESSNSDYRDVELEPGDVVYADIPYEGTNKTGYRGGARFDKAAFSEWGLAQDVPIYVSEQSMPKGWVEVASWEMPSMNAQKKRGEKLFVQEQFAGDGGRATAHRTTRGIQGLDGYTEQDVLDGVRGDIVAKLEDAGVDDVTIKGMALHGSRMRGDAREDSDLDVVVEYEGDWSEDSLFDLLNEEPVYFDGIKVDINPITRGKSGTLEQYMERSRRYDEEKIRANSAQYSDNAGARFSLSGDGTVEEYNRAVNMTGRTFNVGGREVKPGITRYNFQEAFQDAILSVKKLQQVVERHFGIKLPTRENAWMYENRLSSINMHERKSFIDKVYEPMMKIADRIMKRGVKEKELNAYLICKHGLERNKVFAQRDAQEEANEIARNGGTPDMQQLLDKYRQRDYSGLTGVTGIQGDIAVIEAEAQRIVDEFEQKHGQLCNELWDAIRKATQWSLRKSYQSGMMSAATFNHVQNMFQYYVPLRGWSETTAEDVYSYMMGEHGAFNGVLKKAEGRTSVADDPLATIGNMAESALMQGNKNLLKQHLLRMAQNHPTDVCQVRDVWLVEGPGGVWEPHWPNIPDDATPDEIDQILQDHEADMLQLEAGGSAKRVRNNLDIPYRIDPRHVPEHAVVAKVAGVDHVVYINGNPRAAQAINGQTGAPRGSKSGFSRLIDFVFGDLKRFYSSVLTSLNINFSGANFVRDLPHAYAMTFVKYGPLKAAEYIAKSFQVIPWVFKNQLGKAGTSQMDRYFQEFLSSGAVTGYAHINDVDAWKANNKRRFARLSALGKAKVAVPRALGEVINAIGWFSETLELIPRFTAFLVERQAGKDIATATKAAKDITTNFNKKGSEVTPGVWGAVANTLRYMKMFFNPIVQGMYQFVDVATMGKENKWVGPRMVLATMHLPVLGALVPYLNQFLLEALGGDDDDDYWLLNEYTRRNNVCIFTGNGYVKIPIAPVFRELYGMGEVVATRHSGKADNEKTAIDLIDQLRTMGSVEGQSSYNEWSLARFLLPEHFAPLIDVMNNENFTGGPIYYDNNYKEYAPEYTKAKKSTWSPLVAASKWLNEMMGGDEDIAADNSGKWLNPAVWQHVITNVGGGFAQLAGDVVAGVTDITEGKEIDASNIPVLKRFYSGSSDERANWARFGIYKDYEKEYTKAKEKYQALDKRDLTLAERAAEVAKFAEAHPKAAAIYAVWEGGIKGADIPQQLSKLGKDDPAYWDLVKEAVGKAENAMNTGYARAWEQKRKDRPDSMSDKELNERFDKSDNDSIRHIMADEISKRAGSQDYYGRDVQNTWSDKSVAAWEAYQNQRTSADIKADAELSNLLKVDDGEKDKARIKMLGYIKDELNKIRRGKDATSRSAGVKGLGEGDDERVMEELRAARKQLIEDLKSGSVEQAYRNLERRTMRLGLRKKAKEL